MRETQQFYNERKKHQQKRIKSSTEYLELI